MATCGRSQKLRAAATSRSAPSRGRGRPRKVPATTTPQSASSSTGTSLDREVQDSDDELTSNGDVTSDTGRGNLQPRRDAQAEPDTHGATPANATAVDVVEDGPTVGDSSPANAIDVALVEGGPTVGDSYPANAINVALVEDGPTVGDSSPANSMNHAPSGSLAADNSDDQRFASGMGFVQTEYNNLKRKFDNAEKEVKRIKRQRDHDISENKKAIKALEEAHSNAITGKEDVIAEKVELMKEKDQKITELTLANDHAHRTHALIASILEAKYTVTSTPDGDIYYIHKDRQHQSLTVPSAGNTLTGGPFTGPLMIHTAPETPTARATPLTPPASTA